MSLAKNISFKLHIVKNYLASNISFDIPFKIFLFYSGKARKGDGNDLTPNPKKLYAIGKELDKLNRVINDMTPVSELPFNVRPHTRKEKNKLASRYRVSFVLSPIS